MTDVETPVTRASKPAGTVTFLFTDIEGSTRLAQSLPIEAWTAILARHREIVRAAIRGVEGHEEKTEGDGIFAVFPTADGGVRAAVEAQRGLAAEAWPDGVELRVRMGLHTGAGTLDGDGEYIGADVHRAARISSAANGGQVLLSETSSDLVAGGLPAGVALRSLGQHRLKDLRPERICQLTIEGLRADFPPIRSLDSRPNNLPTQLTTFVGREAELKEAAELLATTRLLTLTGPGGTGKTRLSLQLAASVAHDFDDGTWFVALEPIRDPALVASRISTTFGLAETPSMSPRDQLAEWLAERKVLLVLDNFEQVIGAAPLVADLLRSAPKLTIIATSRAALRVSGEQEYPVPGLPVPRDILALSDLEKLNLTSDERAPLAADAVTQYEAVRLFIARALAVRPDFQVTNENAPAVAAICARLHGMPLAIELAAARVKLLTPEAILARLEKQLGVLAAGSRDVPERQQTLRGAIAWSYDLLDDGQRRLLWRLAAFVGGCELDAAEEVCGPSGEIGIDVLDGVMALADQSLVRTEEIDDRTRFRQLDTIHEFAAEHLAASGEEPEIERRHRSFYLALVETAAPLLSGIDQRRWLGTLERDHDNIRAALDHAVAAGDADAAIRIGFAMWRYWQKRGHLIEAKRRLDEIAAQPWSRSDRVLRARLMEALGGVGWWTGDRETLVRAYTEALEIWREIGDKRELANALYNHSFAYAVTITEVDPDEERRGREEVDEALRIYREIGDERGEANVLWGIGNYEYFRGGADKGVPWFEEALAIFRRVGDRTMEAWALHMTGSSRVRVGNTDQGEREIKEALQLFHASGDVAGITLALDDLASVAVAKNELPRAARLWGAARALSSAGGILLADMVDEQYEIYARPHPRNVTDPADFERYQREGRLMSVDEAVAYALDMPVSEVPGPHEHAGGSAG
ncbi:MAG TPA: adenylate/guanylate cyclase domain-containing protein [Candidatus Limnocylindrales bacterium]|nr:adenylate/guanylate cyclase domain-containing protein [Candidatus Limnocylindrales bacterium]